MPSETSFSITINIHETAQHGRVLELVLTGELLHEHPHSSESARVAGKTACDEIARLDVKRMIFNLLDFNYSFGNEIAAVFLDPYVSLARSGGGKIAIVAAGPTANALDDLLKVCHLDQLLGTTHRDFASAVANLTDVPAVSTDRTSIETAARQIVLKRVHLADHNRQPGRTRHAVRQGNEWIEFPPFTSLEIVLDPCSFYLLHHITANGEIAVTLHESVDGAMEQAEFEFGVQEREWLDVKG